ncbi:hypothetical protein DW949_02530 [Megasphaera sp. AM44-1BH]|uniref:hypothetical protein n=1 Tax=Megasphaera sp. AM44-1BH TaxID=2292358 RepID=UPI000E537807|nr:hypothetical protein [Megasphaera sp. AM44-1BH]RHA14984.1 hypothetical protein DW949_02530 [Megasphaera sp. AM44-1BH]DAV18512.1 MAG TPA: N-acetylmuramoyl-L-alanine amidase [Caudoviricetes sp.]
MLKFRDREDTEFVRVYWHDLNGLSVPGLLKEIRRTKGDFTAPYHMIITKDGTIHHIRNLEAVAGYELADNEFGVHILVDSISRDLMTRVQRLSLEDVLNDINVKYPDIPEENYYE